MDDKVVIISLEFVKLFVVCIFWHVQNTGTYKQKVGFAFIHDDLYSWGSMT